ncbi:MAG: hypothetical protein D6738_03345 [Acidobacteria bacterium]|nr:MAG: hypothetical protein D6738_03345 [Acidobacteriota bacterium]
MRRALGGLVDFWVGADTIRRRRHYLLAVAPVGLLAWLGLLPLLGSDRPRAPIDVGLAVLLVLTQAVYATTFPTARIAVQVWPAACWLVSLTRASRLGR